MSSYQGFLSTFSAEILSGGAAIVNLAGGIVSFRYPLINHIDEGLFYGMMQVISYPLARDRGVETRVLRASPRRAETFKERGTTETTRSRSLGVGRREKMPATVTGKPVERYLLWLNVFGGKA